MRRSGKFLAAALSVALVLATPLSAQATKSGLSDAKSKKTALEAETFHIRPTSQVKQGKDGKAYRTYTVLAGSSTYDTKEMSELINGLVAECKEQGIETLPPEELARMMAEYEENHRKKETVQRTDG
mgnify:CR=1 FL=1